MLIAGILIGLLLGLWAGGRISNLGSIQLRWVWILFAAVIVRFGTEALLNAGVPLAETLRSPLLALSFGLLLVGLWENRSYPGLSLAFVGILLNAVVILLNGGYMPIWEPALAAAGFDPSQMSSNLHVVVPGDDIADFLLDALILGDIIPIPIAPLNNVASLGDLFLSMGLGFFLFAGVVRVPTPLETHEEDAIRRRLVGLASSTRLPRPDGAVGIQPETGLAPGLAETAALQRPAMLGSQGPGMATPALAPLPAPTLEGRYDDAAIAAAFEAAGVATTGTTSAGTATPPIAVPRPSPEALARVRRHPYVRLALNGSFTALWAGQLISIFGDRIHQVALAFAVLITTGSPLASSLVFVAAFIPNLVMSPIAGTLVDRWDRREVLIVSDLLRAAIVLLIPMAIVLNVLLVYPLVFVMTSISIFFRPARAAILPQIVRKDELVTANSALWVGETLGDVVGFPLAALFVAALGSAIPVAFWLDAATYIGSAVLLSTLVVHAIEPDEATDGANATIETGAGQGFVAEMKAGYHFLRGEATLFANTIQASVAQLSVGAITALLPTYALVVFGPDKAEATAVYGFLEGATSAGNLIGGFVIGLVGTRFAKGRMVSVGYALWGIAVALLALTGNVGAAIGIAFGSGIANMIFVIPSQALFQERTPAALMGRVIGFRFWLVFGSMAIAMGVGGVLSQLIGVTTVLAVFGLVSVAAGLAGFLVPAIRDAD